MTPYDPQEHHRRSIRLPEWDYHAPGAYFVTLCTQHRQCMFGSIHQDQMVLNAAGEMIQTHWRQIPARFPKIQVDTFVIMPNHVHGIIILGKTLTEGALDREEDAGSAPTLGAVIGALKSLTTNDHIRGVRDRDWPPFDRKLWQRNYYERIIRNDREWNALRRYIQDNPIRWAQDRENPACVTDRHE